VQRAGSKPSLRAPSRYGSGFGFPFDRSLKKIEYVRVRRRQIGQPGGGHRRLGDVLGRDDHARQLADAIAEHVHGGERVCHIEGTSA